MASSESRSAGTRNGWAWVREGEFEIGGCLTFGRDVSAEHLMAEFGMDPSTAAMMTEEEAIAAYVPGRGRPWVPWIRVGHAGDWAFALECVSLMGYLDGVGQRISLGTAAAVVSWTAKPNHDLFYLRDGVTVTHFEPGAWWRRSGSDPDFFLPQMHQLGLRTDRPQYRLSRAERLAEPDRLIAALDVLTLAFGFRISQDVARGPLLTVHRA